MFSFNTIVSIKKRLLWALPVIVLSLAMLFDFFAFLLQVAPGVMSHDLMRDLGINAIILSLISSCYFYAYAGMQIPVGVLLDRFGPRRLVSTALLLCAVGATLFAVSHWVWLSALSQVLLGGSAAFAYVSVLFIALRWFPVRYFGALVGLTELVGALGAIFGEAPLLAIINYFGWRETMFGIALVGLALSCLVFLIVRDRPPHSMPKKTIKNRQRIIDQLRLILRKRQVWVIGFIALLLWAPTITFGSLWGIPYLEARYGFNQNVAASMMLYMWLGTAAGAPTIGWLSSCLWRRQTPLIVYSILGLFASTALLYMPDLPLPLVAIFLFLFGFAASGACLTFALLRDIIPERLIGSAMGFNNMMVVIGGPLCQLLVGLILDLSWDGSKVQNLPHYSGGDFQLALFAMPISFAIVLVISTFYLKPTAGHHLLRSGERQI